MPDDNRREFAQQLLDTHGDGTLDIIVRESTARITKGDTPGALWWMSLLQHCEEIRTGRSYLFYEEV